MVKCRTTDSLCSYLTQSKYENLLLTRGHIITVYNEMIEFFPVVNGLQLINAKLLRVKTCENQKVIDECVKQAESIIYSSL